VVADGHVARLYAGRNVGINDGHWSQEDYAAAYDAFYQSHRSREEPALPGGSQFGTPEGIQPSPGQPSREGGGFFIRLWQFFRSFWERIALPDF
jgi:hypothetical protein